MLIIYCLSYQGLTESPPQNGRDRLRRKEHLGQGGKGDQVPHASVIGSGA